MTSESEAPKKLTSNEAIKENSRNLRGTIAESLRDTSTGGISADDGQLTKFHGLYLQDDRDLRKERRLQKLEKAFSFMIRVRLPGGRCTLAQYLTMDELSREVGNDTIRLTTRQPFQLHGILKGNLRPMIQRMDKALMDSIGACGDINRNVMFTPNPEKSGLHTEIYELSKKVSEHLLPTGKAYHEIWIGDEKVAGGEAEEEPLYGKTYLPRKFKIGFAVPPSNDVDVYSQDLGFVAIVEEGRLLGFNVSVGGGLGMSHGRAETYPRLADTIGFCTADQINQLAEAVVTAQRDYGDRTNRRHARLKYTIDDRGIEWFKNEVETRAGFKLAEAHTVKFTTIEDDYGWRRSSDGKWFFTLFIQSGRIADTADRKLKTALREIAQLGEGNIRLSPSQNLSVAGLSDEAKVSIEAILEKYGLGEANKQTGLRLNSLACPALPTCGLALAESEREIPDILDQLEKVLKEVGLENDAISIRMTGCPNGCARPYLAEIGIVGRAPGKYSLFLGAKYNGTRLNREVATGVTTVEMIEQVSGLFREYAADRQEGEEFGDFCVRNGHVPEPAKA
ncbi:MAG: NADPH-dependent assimilatory sulfite reductase hemoprotein subunit [Opitutaceae bacterium]|nr:NADPH-dependent assimilatory sulfite reductase hemoprotein subunit [Opitutaceae bacterium]